MKSRKQCVYVCAMSNDTIKIGITQDLQRRQSQIRNSSGLDIINSHHTNFVSHEIARSVELACHQAFADRRLAHGEFFNVSFEEACAELAKHTAELSATTITVEDSLQIFTDEQFGRLRTIVIDGVIWFVGKDVAIALGYKDSVNALKSHVDAEDKMRWRMPTPSRGLQTVTLINISGVFSLILGSKLPKAKAYRHWVTSVVLPEIHNYKPAPPEPEIRPFEEAVPIMEQLEEDGVDWDFVNFEMTQELDENGNLVNVIHCRGVINK